MAPGGLQSPGSTPMPAGGAPGAGPATLAGGPPDQGDQGGPPPPSPEGGGPGGGMSSMLGQAVQQALQTEVMLTDLARQFPAAAPAFQNAVVGLRQAGTALRAALRQIMTSPGQQEPPSPGIGG